MTERDRVEEHRMGDAQDRIATTLRDGALRVERRRFREGVVAVLFALGDAIGGSVDVVIDAAREGDRVNHGDLARERTRGHGDPGRGTSLQWRTRRRRSHARTAWRHARVGTPGDRRGCSPPGENRRGTRNRLALTPSLSRKRERGIDTLIDTLPPALRGRGQGEGAMHPFESETLPCATCSCSSRRRRRWSPVR